MRTTIALSAIAAIALAQMPEVDCSMQPTQVLYEQCEAIKDAIAMANGEAEAEAEAAFDDIMWEQAMMNDQQDEGLAIAVALNITDSASAVANAFGTIIETVANSIEDREFSLDSQDAIKNATANAAEAIDLAQQSVWAVEDSNRGYNSYSYGNYNYENSYYNYNYGDYDYSSYEQDAQAAWDAAAAAAEASYYNSYSYQNLMLAKTSLANNNAEFYSSVNAVQTGANVVAIVVSLLVSLCCLSIIICCFCFYCAAAKTANDLNQLNQPLIDQESQDKQQEPATL